MGPQEGARGNPPKSSNGAARGDSEGTLQKPQWGAWALKGEGKAQEGPVGEGS